MVDHVDEGRPGASLRKTALGMQEIDRRGLGLSPLARRLLILIDGQRDAEALQVLMGGHAVAPLLDLLVEKGCVEPNASRGTGSPVGSTQAGELPQRSASQLDMGRHFIVNTLSTFTGPYAHADLMSAAMKAAGQGELRDLVPVWRAALEVEVPAKRLAQLEADLLRVI